MIAFILDFLNKIGPKRKNFPNASSNVLEPGSCRIMGLLGAKNLGQTEGKPDYEIKYQVLTLQKKPGIAEKILGVGIGVAQIFFPYQVFLGQVGMFGVEVLTRSETRGLRVETDETEEVIAGGMVSEIYELDMRMLF